MIKMGFQEDIAANIEGQIIKYNDKYYYISRDFNYKGTRYLYGFDPTQIDKRPLEVLFIYRMSNGKYSHVDDQNQFEELLKHVSNLFKDEVNDNNFRRLKNLY